MVKINFRFTSPGIKVLGLFFFFFPWKTSRAKLRSDNVYVVEMPILLQKSSRRSLVGYVFSSQFEGNNGVKEMHASTGWGQASVERRAGEWQLGSLITATAFTVSRHREPDGEQMETTWKWQALCLGIGRMPWQYNLASREAWCHRFNIRSDYLPLQSMASKVCLGRKAA